MFFRLGVRGLAAWRFEVNVTVLLGKSQFLVSVLSLAALQSDAHEVLAERLQAFVEHSEDQGEHHGPNEFCQDIS